MPLVSTDPESLLARARGAEARVAEQPETDAEKEPEAARDAWLTGWRQSDSVLQEKEALRHAMRQHRMLTILISDLLVRLDNQRLEHCQRTPCHNHATRRFGRRHPDARRANEQWFGCDHHTPDDAASDARGGWSFVLLPYADALREVQLIAANNGLRYIDPDHGHLSNGLYDKYLIAKADGLPIDPRARYFTLRYDTDPFARIALHAYAQSIAPRNPKLAKDIFDELDATAEHPKEPSQ